ncbi:AAA family ATPase, partial [Acinetobacter pittii]
MKLINIQIFPKGNNGWGSDLLTFGDDITQLFGPNGCGKTPIIQSIAYCLGYPCTFRQDIYDHCLNVKLKIKTEKGNLVITRKYHKSDFEIEVIEP